MLFHDPSCRAEVTLKENHAMGMYRLCQLDWVAICTKTNQGAIYIDAQRDETGAAGDIPQRFLDQYGHELTCDDGMQLFQMEDCYFRKTPSAGMPATAFRLVLPQRRRYQPGQIWSGCDLFRVEVRLYPAEQRVHPGAGPIGKHRRQH